MAGPIDATSPTNSVAAVTGTNTGGGIGVLGRSPTFCGLWGESTKSAGTVGKSVDWRGVDGQSVNNAGVFGLSQNFVGVWGESPKSAGVAGKSVAWRGVDGQSVNNAGVFGFSQNFVGIWAETQAGHPAIFAKGPSMAARFEGNVQVTGDVQLVNADCAENFDVMDSAAVDADAGSVMVLGEGGALCLCEQAYDKRVAGVISGAGSYRPAIVMDSQGDQSMRRPIALVGKVYCKVDADYAPVEVGDLLTTSPTSGHAMKAADTSRALGTIMGKALAPVKSGQTLIPILVCLQ
jgi:hypothetical protein